MSDLFVPLCCFEVNSTAEAANKQTYNPGNYRSITEVVSTLKSNTDPVQAASSTSVIWQQLCRQVFRYTDKLLCHKHRVQFCQSGIRLDSFMILLLDVMMCRDTSFESSFLAYSLHIFPMCFDSLDICEGAHSASWLSSTFASDH